MKTTLFSNLDCSSRKRRFPKLEQDWLARQTLLTQQLDLGLLRDWLDTCEQDHEKCSAVNAAKDSDGTPSAPIKLILIDVHLEQLVEATSEFRYVALSYVMGQAKVLNTVKANYAALQPEGALSGSERTDSTSRADCDGAGG